VDDEYFADQGLQWHLALVDHDETEQDVLAFGGLERRVGAGYRPDRCDEAPASRVLFLEIGDLGIAHRLAAGAVFADRDAPFEQYPAIGVANLDTGDVGEGGGCGKRFRDVLRRTKDQGQPALDSQGLGYAQAVLQLAGV